MILLYHKIGLSSPSQWWVTVDAFYRQLCELGGRRVVNLDEYDPADPEQVVITFDGVYQDVLRYAAPLLNRKRFPFELFISGDHVGADNEFDSGEPPARFANENDLQKLVQLGGRLQWHTRSHRKLLQIEDSCELAREFEVPEKLKKLDPFGFRWLAYPYGAFSAQSRKMAETFFQGAVSVNQGSDSDRYCLNRIPVLPDGSLSRSTVAIIVASYNYGSYLAEAMDSALRQTRPVDEILISDDCSSDDTPEIAAYYTRKYPERVRYHRCPQNLGIVAHFNLAVSLTHSDYICILGADNCLNSSYIEMTSEILDRDPQTAVAYTDFALFGPRARIIYKQFPEAWRGEVKNGSFFIIHFPDYDEEIAKAVQKRNFIHGSSLFRRQAFEQAGRYQSQKDRPEDHDLFLRMIRLGWRAKRVARPILEYRQHSLEQANVTRVNGAQLQVFREQLAAYRKIADDRFAQIKILKAELKRVRMELQVRIVLDHVSAGQKGKIKVVIFGTGSMAEIVAAVLDDDRFSLLGFFDNNEARWSEQFRQLDVRQPSRIEGVKVIVASSWREDIMKQLLTLGYRSDDIVTF